MAKLTMATSANFKPREKKLTQVEMEKITESRKVNLGYSQEWPRQKLRISDLYPDEKFLKENLMHEYKYFILMVLPVIVTSAVVLIHRNNLYNEFLAYLEEFFSQLW
ncbi:hypothetical protein J6W78_02430 [bacterium]|nr:hypothetical protein [bacterium]